MLTSATAELSAPSWIQVNSRGDIYALDSRNRRIVHLGPAGDFKGALSFDGAPPPTTIMPKSFKLDAADNIYVLDVFSARVLVVSAAGQFQKAVPIPEEVGFVSDLTVDSTGTVILLDSIKRRLYTAAKDANAFAPLGGSLAQALATLPTYMTGSKGILFVLEGSGSSIVSLGRDGSFLARQLAQGRNEGSLDHPSQLCITDKDDVFVADRGNSRIQVFSLIR